MLCKRFETTTSSQKDLRRKRSHIKRLLSIKRAIVTCPFLSRQNTIKKSTSLYWKEQAHRRRTEDDHYDLVQIISGYLSIFLLKVRCTCLYIQHLFRQTEVANLGNKRNHFCNTNINCFSMLII